MLTVVGASLASWQLLQAYLIGGSLKVLLSWLVIAILVLSASFILVKIPDQRSTNYYVIGSLLGIFAIIYLIWIKQTPAQQSSDYHTFWKTAEAALQGVPIYHSDNGYFAKWAYQTGFLAYVMLVVRLFGHQIQVVQYLNVVQQLLIEVQGRYRLEFMPFLAIIAAIGLDFVGTKSKQSFTLQKFKS